jgi:hypothetical protein
MTTSPRSGLLRSAAEQGRRRVFGEGLDRGFLLMLALAVAAGGVVLAGRSDAAGWLALLVGLTSMAVYVAMPFVVVTIFCTFSALVSLWAGRPDAEETPMGVVLLAFAFTLPIVVALVALVGQIPLVGAQLRGMFG